MSEEAPAGLTIAEKVFGLILVVLGALVFYYSPQTPKLAGIGFIFFPAFGIFLIAIGLFLVFSKAE